ncbi:hypothetical protein [Streptomyces sp. NBC_01408]|uniref:hypothetical protein n=1 Tax=Streptomyces sp. NBC_01408 TaxID=2903855 RepID=UPI0022522580|nr:hypothetical protein [Streptomyces sp. NBC_01408]MCX4692865.1 hypothetical protein [Streptomyces sp. NBC_01408]
MITAQRRPSGRRRTRADSSAAGQVTTPLVPGGFIYFWPIYTGQTLPMDSWRGRMWLDTWV